MVYEEGESHKENWKYMFGWVDMSFHVENLIKRIESEIIWKEDGAVAAMESHKENWKHPRAVGEAPRGLGIS